MKGTSPSASAISAQPTNEASRPPRPKPNASCAAGSPSATNPTATGSRTATASRTVRVVSTATPRRSPAAPSREAEGSMAVANETVTSECGRIQTAYALAYDVRPAPRPPTVASVASRLTTTSASWVTATKPRVQRASRKVWPSPLPRRSSRGENR